MNLRPVTIPSAAAILLTLWGMLVAAGGAPGPAHAQQDVPSTSATLPPGPIASPTLPPGPITGPTLPPGPTFHQSTTIFKAVGSHWLNASSVTLNSRVRFQLCFDRSGLAHPGARLRIQRGSSSPANSVLYTKSMVHTRTNGSRLCFAATVWIDKPAARGRDVATFTVSNDRTGVIAFTRPFTVR